MSLVIDAGGNGCIFKPSLQCVNTKDIKNNSIKDNYVSKLMISHDAKDELKEIANVQNIIKTIPNNSKYFLLSNISHCTPKKLSPSELSSFKDKCKIFEEDGYHYNEINDNIQNFSIINMPYGGINLDKFYYSLVNKEAKMRYNILVKLHKELLNLLKNGIIKVNNKGLYHFDIKGSNILVQEGIETKYNTLQIKLIDWGLSELIKSTEKKALPLNSFNGRPFQFNLPVGSLLLNQQLYPYLKELIKKNNNKSDRNVCYDLLNKSFILNPLAKEHFDYVANNILAGLTDVLESQEQKKNYAYYILCNQLELIINKYYNFNNNSFDKTKYFKEVFSYNCDIFGFLLSFNNLLHFHSHKHFNTPKENTYINKLKKVINKYCYSNEYVIKKIPLATLINDLEINYGKRINNKTRKNRL
jgi:hypothetical protein